MSSDKAVTDLVEETLETLELAGQIYRFEFEPRCRVCQNDKVRVRVNALLTEGNTYTQVIRTVAAEAEALGIDPERKVGMDSVRTHALKHFPVQNAARSTFREIMERRAAEGQVDFVGGTSHAITPMALLETVMVKGYHHIIQSSTEIGVHTSMTAAVQLQNMLDARESSHDAQELAVQLNKIIEAVRSTVPVAMWDEIVRKLRDEEALEEQQPIEAEFEDEDDDFDPTATAERDEDDL